MILSRKKLKNLLRALCMIYYVQERKQKLSHKQVQIKKKAHKVLVHRKIEISSAQTRLDKLITKMDKTENNVNNDKRMM